MTGSYKTESVACLLCGCDESRTLYAFDSGIAVVTCCTCGFIYTTPRLTREERLKLYSGGYFSGGADVSMGVDYTGTAFSLFSNDAVERFHLLLHYLPSGSQWNILELGSAAGFFLKECATRGHNALGIEVSEDMCSFASKELGVACVNGDVSSVELEEASNDAVALWHVLEHLEKPVETLKLLHTTLNRNGFIFITVPNFESGHSRRDSKHWCHLQSEIHLSHFTKGSLCRILDECGFDIIAFSRSASTGILGNNSTLHIGIKSLIRANIGRLGFIRKPVKYIMSNYLGMDDFITVVARKKL